MNNKIITPRYMGGGGKKYYKNGRYKRINYIESTGTQYIDTRIKTSNKLRLEYIIQRTGLPSTKNWVLGTGGDTSGTLFSFRGTGTGNIKYYSIGVTTFDIGVSDDLNKHTLVTDVQNKFVIADGIVHNFTGSPSGTTYKIYLFAYNRIGTVDANYSFIGKMFGMKIYDNGDIVRDYIPVLDRQTNKAGLYDRVTNIFYGNNGTGDFIYG